MILLASVLAGLVLAPAAHPTSWAGLKTRPYAGDLQAFRASGLVGRVVFSGVPVPGATVTATRGDRVTVCLSDEAGLFRLVNLDDGIWTLRVEMRGFVTATRDVVVPYNDEPLVWMLTMQRFEEIVGRRPDSRRPPATPPPFEEGVEDPAPDLADIINGSMVNGAASPFAQSRAFGNNRPSTQSLYSGAINAVFGDSSWNARPYSFTASAVPPPSYGDLQIGFMLGGPLRIPWILPSGPQMVFSVQHGVSHTANTQSALMPTSAERAGDLSQRQTPIRDPRTGMPFPGNVIPSTLITPQASALLAHYPLPNVAATQGANYETALLKAGTRDDLQLALNQSFGRRTTLSGTIVFHRLTTDSVSLFGFYDVNRESNVNATANFTRRVNERRTVRLRYQFTRAAVDATPFFANRANVSAEAGIAGNNQDPENWGPPAIAFPDIADLRDIDHQRTTRRTHAGGAEIALRRGTHNITIGGDLRSQQVEVSSQPDPRGTLTFTGAATGDGFADFLLGIPTASAIAFGPSRAHLLGGAYDAYVADDWRVFPNLTLNLGVRWEYESPFTEASDRLVNLDVAPDFSAVRAVVASDPNGTLTGRAYPASLIEPDRLGIQPRLAASWRPALGSAFLIRAGYGIYRNLGAYESMALLLSQQPPLATAFSIQNSPLTPLTLAHPFPSSIPTTTNTVAVDPDFRSAYAHIWQLSVQRELPSSLTAIVSYLGTAGRHLVQAFLPNTYPAGGERVCATCPSGFVYITSNAASRRDAAQFVLRRRLHSGFTASAQYIFAKATDSAATFNNKAITAGSLAVAQDWLDLSAERGPSSFDQRHLASLQFQYTTGVGIAGGTLVDGVRGLLFKDWTIAGQMNAGSGLPLTPVSFAAVGGAGTVGVRPSLTGAPREPPDGAYANPAAYMAPPPGTWGNAGRNSMRGPSQFSLDMSVTRVVRLRGRVNGEWRLVVTNVLNRVTFATVDTVMTSPQFGRPTVANPMRTLQLAARVRF